MKPVIAEFVSQSDIRVRVTALAAEIRRDIGPGVPVHLVCVLTGAVVFLSDLMRAIEGPVSCDFIGVKSYAGTTSTGQVRILKDLDRPVTDRHVIIVEDIVDTGLTLAFLQELIRSRAPESLRTACLLNKPSRRTVKVPVDYVGFTIDDRFVVGYGLDFEEQYRHLPFVGVMRDSVVTGGETAEGVAALIDHTLLKADATRDEVSGLCREAAFFKFAAVCVNPVWVSHCVDQLKHTFVPVSAVVGFPLGATTPDVKAHETRRVILDGAREVDMVINVGALKDGDLELVQRDIDAVVRPCREAGVVSKVIIETALLTENETVAACTMAKTAGADFVKTSTGFGPSGATVADVVLMRQVVGPEMGIKAAGGIRDLDQVLAMVAAGATRVGTSAGVKIVRQLRND